MKKKIVILLAVALLALSFVAIAEAGKPAPPPPAGDYLVIAQPEGGMKCMIKKDYSVMAIMPPGYNLRAQVFKRGVNGTADGLVTSGITVEYSIDNNTYAQNGSPAKTNFWTYASNFGWNLTMDKGTKGYGLAGTMALEPSGKAFEALKIPQVPFNDGNASTQVPYQRARVKVKDASGAVIAETTTTMPSSIEMRCDVCHGGNMDAVTDQDIIADHDRLHGTNLVGDGKSNLCSECHADVSIGKAGIAGIPALSTAMHTAHSTRMSASPYSRPVCYTCHPGPTVDCYRGEMGSKSCDTSACHGSMANVGSATRKPWVDLPKCANCHQAKYGENTGKLFRDSFLTVSPDPLMNNQMYCQSCHGAQHAEYTSDLAIDNEQPIKFQGTSDQIGKGHCEVCHAAAVSGSVHR